MCKPRRGLRVSHALGLLFSLAQELDAGLRAQDVERREARTSGLPSEERAHNIEQNSLCYTLGPSCLPVLNITVHGTFQAKVLE